MRRMYVLVAIAYNDIKFLCLIQHYDIKTYGGVKAYPHTFCTTWCREVSRGLTLRSLDPQRNIPW